jgi:putative phosphoribosyl transferase
MLPIANRSEAGRALAKALSAYRGRDDVLVLALPRGGVPVACEIAKALRAPVDLMVVRKLGAPGQEELAMGAIASGDVRVLNEDVILARGIGHRAIDEAAAREQRELRRRETAYRGDRPRSSIGGKCIILVDDAVATGATMRAAIAAVRSQKSSWIVVAVPVAPVETVTILRGEADEVVCLETPEPFWAIGQWYVQFPQVSDDEVRRQLHSAWEVPVS